MSLGIFQVFAGLPTCLSCTVLSKWLDLKSVCLLDSALCERKKRDAVSTLLQSIECVGKFGSWYNKQLVWLNRRSIRTNELLLSDKHSREVLEEYLQRFGQHVRSVREGPQPCAHYLPLVAQHCHGLINVGISYWSRDSLEGSGVLRGNSNLVELSITCYDKCASFSGIVLPKLKFIYVFGQGCDDLFCKAILNSCKQLVFLSLLHTQLSSSGLIEVVQFCPNLTYVMPPDLLDIDHALQHITKVCIHIQHLDLANCRNLSDAGVIAIAENVRALRTIHFTYSPRITNACLDSLAKHQYGSLEEFAVIESFTRFLPEPAGVEPSAENLQTFNTAAVSLFRAKCQQLRVFDWQRLVSWHTPDAEARIMKYVCSADRVTTLYLFYINDNILSAVAMSCKQLEILELAFSESVHLCTDELLVKVAAECSTLCCVIVYPSQVARVLQLYNAYPNIHVHSCSSNVYSYNLQSVYQRDEYL